MGLATPIQLNRSSRDTGQNMFLRQLEMVQTSRPSHVSLFTCQGIATLLFIFVYIHPRGNIAMSTEPISRHINKLNSISPLSYRQTLKTFHQYVSCPTRMNKTINSCCSSKPAAYASVTLCITTESAGHDCVLVASIQISLP